jgi:hypothetical protein
MSELSFVAEGQRMHREAEERYQAARREHDALARQLGEMTPAHWNYRALVRRRNAAGDRMYEAYMLTLAWERKRLAVLRAAGRQCQLKRPGCTKRAETAHHLTYERLGCERPGDLVAACPACHAAIHGRDVLSYLSGEKR